MRELLRTLWKVLTHRGLWGHGIFWSWHAVYTALLAFGILPYVAAPVTESWWHGTTPTGIFLTCVALTALPVVSMGVGIWSFARQPEKLLALFYGLSAPALTVLLFRLFAIREMTSGVAWLGLVLAAAMIAYGVELFRGLPKLGPEGELLRLIAHSAMLAVTLYFGALMGAFVPGLATLFVTELLPELPRGLWELLTEFRFRDLWGAMLGLIFLTFWLLTMTYWLFLVPVAATLMGRSWWRAFQRASAPLGQAGAWAVTGLSLFGLGVGFYWTTQQPQEQAFALLAEPPQSDAERMALLEEAGVIRAGLLNAALASYRYLDTDKAAQGVSSLYEEAWGLEEEQAMALQGAWNHVASPFLYRGQNDDPERRWGRGRQAFALDNDEAEALYERFFDVPMQRAEKQAMLTAIQATYDVDAVEAGLLNIGERRVRLESQAVTVTEHQGFAEVEVAEVYRNQTFDQQELVYLFSLPRSAAMTGLWLGTSPDKARADAYTVAPRGAAQAVYIAERERRVDPALLEQVGPQQYRLRAFPAPPKPRGNALGEPAPAFYMWFSYTTPAGDGGWPAPRLAEARNVYWDSRTEREGVLRELDEREQIEGWFPALLPAESAANLAPKAHEVALADGSVVRATPRRDDPDPKPHGLDLLVVLDTSLSMAQHADAAMAAVQTLRDEVAGANTVEVVVTRSPYGGGQPEKLDVAAVEEPLWYGGHSLYGVIAQIPTQAHLVRVLDASGYLEDGPGPAAIVESIYDAILVLTDGGALTLAEDHKALLLQTPLWLVHLDDDYPAQYDDAVLEMVQSTGGGVAGSVQDALARVAMQQAAVPGFIDLTEDYTWTLEDTDKAADTDPAFAAMAARQLAVQRSRAVDLGSLDALDGLHNIAVAHHVVTPYSSMIVLVNDRQREALERASEAEDRFEREVETGVEAVGPQAFGELTATPEPEEWALIGVAVILLMLGWRREQEVGWRVRF